VTLYTLTATGRDAERFWKIRYSKCLLVYFEAMLVVFTRIGELNFLVGSFFTKLNTSCFFCKKQCQLLCQENISTVTALLI